MWFFYMIFRVICDFVTFFIFLFFYYNGINVIGIRGIQLCCWTFCKPFFRIFVTIPLTKHAVQIWSRQRILATNVSVPVLCPVSASQNISTLTITVLAAVSAVRPVQHRQSKWSCRHWTISFTKQIQMITLCLAAKSRTRKVLHILISFVLAVFLMKLFYICF